MKNIFLFFVFLTFFFLNTHIYPTRYKKIVSISPVVTEIIYALNAEKSLIGVTNACNYPSSAKLKPKIGDFTHPNLEKIVALNPDLVIGMGNKMAPDALKLTDLKIQTKILDSPEKIEQIYNLILEIGKCADKEIQAENLVKNLKKDVENFMVNNTKIHPNVLCIIWAPPIMAVGENTFISEMIKLAGGTNIIKSKMQFPPISNETIIYNNPDIIIVTEKKLQKLIEANIAIRNTKAYDQKKIVYNIDPDIISRPGPRFVEGIRALREVFF